MPSVAILAFDQVAFFELGCAIELFALPRPELVQWYQADVVSFEAGPLRSTAGIQIQTKVVNSLQAYDTLVIPCWSTENSAVPQALAVHITDFYASGKRVLSFCSGAFLLAELGLFNGKRATTHWRYAELFKQRYPQVDYVDNVLYVHEERLGCSAGSAAALDLGIDIIRHDFGYDVANIVARRLVMSPHRKGGQAQFVETPVIKQSNQFAEALSWAIENIMDVITVDDFARRATMSRRTFDRKFREAYGLTAKQWLVNQRLQLARQYIQETDRSIEQVATMTGFDNATTMRHHFRKNLGVSPRQYRDQFVDTKKLIE